MPEYAETRTLGAGSDGIVEREHHRLELTDAYVMLGAGVILRKEHLLAADNVHESKSIGELEHGLETVRHAGFDAILDDDTVNDYLDVVLFVFVELYFLGELVHDAVNAHADESRAACGIELLCVLTLSVADDRREELELCALRQSHYRINYLVDALLGYLAPADRTVGDTDTRVEKSEVVVYLGHCSDGRAWILGSRFLVDRDSGRESFDAVNIGFFHLSEEHSRIRGKALDVSALTVSVDSVERERGFSRAGKSRHDDELVTRYLEVDVFEVVGAGAFDYNFIYHSGFLLN